MAHLVKCLYCKQTFDTDKEEFTKPNERRYAHKACTEKYQKEKTKEEQDKENLENYIKELFGISCISPKIKKQIKDFHEKDKYTYTGIHKTLKYFFEIKGNSIDKANNGIGIVSYVYDQANKYYYALWEARQRNEGVQINDFVLPEREVHVSLARTTIKLPFRRQFAFLEEG